MKTVLFKISGEPVGGDLAVVAYTTPRGGMSYAIYPIKGERANIHRDDNGDPVLVNGQVKADIIPADTLAQIAVGLVDAVNNPKGEFCAEQFHAAAMNDILVVSCTDAVSDVTFISQIQGTGTGKIEQL